jgi:hypothetical protein
MSITRDAYIFDPNKFVIQVNQFLNKFISRKEGYQYIRTETLKILEKNQNVAFLASEYGGWDYFSIKTQIPEDYPKHIEDIVFWFSLLLFSHVEKTENANLGLEANFELMENILNEYGWNEKEIKLPIYGRPFSELLPSPSSMGLYFRIGDVDIEQLWDYFQPNSTLGKFSWINFDDIKFLLSKLEDEQNKITQIINEGNNRSEIEMVFHKYVKRLEEATNYKAGLLYVISG